MPPPSSLAYTIICMPYQWIPGLSFSGRAEPGYEAMNPLDTALVPGHSITGFTSLANQSRGLLPCHCTDTEDYCHATAQTQRITVMPLHRHRGLLPCHCTDTEDYCHVTAQTQRITAMPLHRHRGLLPCHCTDTEDYCHATAQTQRITAMPLHRHRGLLPCHCTDTEDYCHATAQTQRITVMSLHRHRGLLPCHCTDTEDYCHATAQTSGSSSHGGRLSSILHPPEPWYPVMESSSFIPRPQPAFRCLQHGTASDGHGLVMRLGTSPSLLSVLQALSSGNCLD